MKCKICGKECGKYNVCFEHKNTKYQDICKIHGKTTFIGNQCQKCKDLKTAIYVIKDNKDRFGNTITKKHFLYPFKARLTHTSRKYQSQFMQRISKTAGIYGIFYKDTCLYVGQSVNIINRIKQHKENFKTAQYHLNGLKRVKKRVSISKIPHKVEFKYYEMCCKYQLKDLSFKTLMAVPRLVSDFEYKELLTYCEQAMITAYKPKFNHIAARASCYLGG